MSEPRRTGKTPLRVEDGSYQAAIEGRRPCPDCARLRADLAAAQMNLASMGSLRVRAQERAEVAEAKLARAREALDMIADDIGRFADPTDAANEARKIARAALSPPAAQEPECEHDGELDIGNKCSKCGRQFVACGPCSEAGGAGRVVWHEEPACNPAAEPPEEQA